MEDKFRGTKKFLTDKLELPREIVLDLPKITVYGNNEITIENHRGIILFEKENVKLNSTIGIIRLQGENFEILYMGGSTLVLSGRFNGIAYEG